MPADDKQQNGRIGDLIETILAERPLRAGAFIVTVYGDLIEPRGGVLWMGNLIETCAAVGISETLVRTAVSRLLAAGRLSGEREGRRSFYRLSASARAEFSAAAQVLFGARQPANWRFVHLSGADADDDMLKLERAGFRRLAPRLLVGARPVPSLSRGALVFKADIVEGQGAIAAFAADYWDLDPLAEAYRLFLRQFEPMAALLADGAALSPAAGLTARLLLVHHFRAVVLTDPRLPDAALPADWPGEAARRLFARLYSALSPLADAHVAGNFVTASGPLPENTPATAQRLATLKAGEAGPSPCA